MMDTFGSVLSHYYDICHIPILSFIYLVIYLSLWELFHFLTPDIPFGIWEGLNFCSNGYLYIHTLYITCRTHSSLEVAYGLLVL